MGYCDSCFVVFELFVRFDDGLLCCCCLFEFVWFVTVVCCDSVWCVTGAS